MTQPTGSPTTIAPQQVADVLSLDMRRGYRTTEFWVAITTWLLPILTLTFHQDLSSLAVPLATLAAGLANAAYTISRAITKSGRSKAVATAASAANAPQLDVKDVVAWASTMAGAVQALTAALATTRSVDGKPAQSAAAQS